MVVEVKRVYVRRGNRHRSRSLVVYYMRRFRLDFITHNVTLKTFCKVKTFQERSLFLKFLTILTAVKHCRDKRPS